MQNFTLKEKQKISLKPLAYDLRGILKRLT
jgi:hypothetical protein